MDYAEKPSMTIKPDRLVTKKVKQTECNHTYKELDADVRRAYGDNKVHATIVDAVFYCEKCLDIKQKVVSFCEDEHP